MIAFNNVYLFRPGGGSRSPILVDGNLTIGTRERVGILAAAGSGKSALARLFCGIDTPDSGQVTLQGRVSWPIGFAGYLHPQVSVLKNLHLHARLTGQDPAGLVAFCVRFCDLTANLDRPVQDISPSERAALAYSCNMAVPFDFLIADDTITPTEEVLRLRSEALLGERLANAGLVFLSKNARQLKRHCDRFFVLASHRLIPCDDLDVAQVALDLSKQNVLQKESTYG